MATLISVNLMARVPVGNDYISFFENRETVDFKRMVPSVSIQNSESK